MASSPQNPNLEKKIIISRFESWNLEFGTWNLEFGTWDLDLGPFSAPKPPKPASLSKPFHSNRG